MISTKLIELIFFDSWLKLYFVDQVKNVYELIILKRQILAIFWVEGKLYYHNL